MSWKNLTDRANWHHKVFDEETVSEWRKEALAIPDAYLWDISVSEKSQEWPDDDGLPVLKLSAFLECKLESIMEEATFQSVGY